MGWQCRSGEVTHGEGWLREPPERELITNRYLKHQKRLTREALTRLIGEEEPEAEELAEIHTREEEAIEKPISLAEQRMGAVMAALRSSGAKRVLDLGCGEGRLLRKLLKDKTFAEIVGLDVSHRVLEIAAQRAGEPVPIRDLPLHRGVASLWVGARRAVSAIRDAISNARAPAVANRPLRVHRRESERVVPERGVLEIHSRLARLPQQPSRHC